MRDKIQAIPLWQGDITVAPLTGGRTNANFLVQDDTGKYVVRFGHDIPQHHVLRFNELAASRAAHLAGLSPAVVYVGEGISVLPYIDSYTLQEKDVAQPAYLARIVDLMKSCHHDIAPHLRGPVLAFWVFHVVQDYVATLQAGNSPYTPLLAEFLETSARLQKAVGKVELVFCHNDWMAANILDDGARLWLIDWDYAGFNSPLFDLGGLAANNELDRAQEREMLTLYYGQAPDAPLLRRYYAMKCAALLRETLWSMVAELTSDLDVDYVEYTAQNLARLRKALQAYERDEDV